MEHSGNCLGLIQKNNNSCDNSLLKFLEKIYFELTIMLLENLSCIKAVGSFFMVRAGWVGGEGLNKNVGHHG